MLIRGDARALPLADRSVQCVVTSPPYFGLRDYGTATWIGGDPSCGHDVIRWDGPKQTQGAMSGHAAKADRLDRQACHCGAVRVDAQIGLESTPEAYVAQLVAVFREVRRVLRDDGTVWLNLGDSYNNADKWGGGGANTGKHTRTVDGAVPSWAGVRRKWSGLAGTKPKDLLGIPWRVAFALQADGWYLRSDIIWAKPNPMPESVTDRPTKAHEYLFLLAKSERYAYDADAIREVAAVPLRDFVPATGANHNDAAVTLRRDGSRHGGGQLGVAGWRNKRSVWTVATMPYSGAHFATMPEALVAPCILAGCPPGGRVLDPFVGSGTVVDVAQRLGRLSVGVDLAYQDLARRRSRQRGLCFVAVGE